MAKHIAVIGSPGSGKSVFSTALAKGSVNRKKRAIIISGDHVVPMMPFFCGNSDVMGLGDLCSEEITPQRVARAVKVLPKYPDIGVMAMQLKDDTAGISSDKLLRISEILDHMVDIVIWDGSSDCNSVFDQTILAKCDLTVCILTAEPKGVLYFEQNCNTLVSLEKRVFLEGLGRPYSPREEMSVRIGGFNGMLPYSRQIERVYLEGELFSVDQVCPAIYQTTVERIIEQLLQGKEG